MNYVAFGSLVIVVDDECRFIAVAIVAQTPGHNSVAISDDCIRSMLAAKEDS